MQKKRTKDEINKTSNGIPVGSFGSLNEGFIPTAEQSKEIIDNFKSIISTRLDKLYSTKGADGELYAYGIAVNQVKKKAEQPEETPTKETPTEEPMDKETKLKEMIQAALSKPLSEKKKSFPDLTGDGKVTQADILKGRGVIDEFESEEELIADEPISEDLDLGHQDDEPHMLKADLYRIGKYAMELYKMVDQFEGEQEVDFPHWWQSKIIKAKDMLVSAKHYLDFEIKEPQINAMVDVAAQEDVIDEKLKPSMGAGAYVDDFRQSDAPQFKGKSKKKKNKMAVAAYLSAKDKIKEAILAKLQESKGEYAKIEKQIADLKLKGKNAGDAEMQKLIKRRAELEKSKK
jgi:hypothetical protein